MDKDGIIARIRQRLADLQKSSRKASLEAGMSADAIRDLERKPDNSPTLKTIQALALSLQTTPEWLAFGVGETSLHDGSEDSMPIKGEVAAGQWLEVDNTMIEGELRRAPVAFSPQWPRAAQYGLVVKGTSINRRAQDGDILRCIDIAEAGLSPREGDLVIVQQERDHGALREVTAKIFKRSGSKIILEPDSTDDRHKPIMLDGDEEQDGTTASIVAIVDLILRPILRS